MVGPPHSGGNTIVTSGNFQAETLLRVAGAVLSILQAAFEIIGRIRDAQDRQKDLLEFHEGQPQDGACIDFGWLDAEPSIGAQMTGPFYSIPLIPQSLHIPRGLSSRILRARKHYKSTGELGRKTGWRLATSRSKGTEPRAPVSK
jgi:hypothetical protein